MRGFSFFFACCAFFSTSCARDAVVFYEVLRTLEAECEIRSNGEFCVEEEQFDPPVFEVWAFEVKDDGVARLYADQEVWVLEPVEEGEDPFLERRRSERRQIVTEGSGPCTTTTLAVLSFKADGRELEGQIEQSTVLTGPEACGTTPTGEREEIDVEGVAFVDANDDGVEEAVGP